MRRRVSRLLLAVIVPLALLGAVEGALRALGIGWPATFFLPDTIAGRAVWRDNPEFGLVCFAPGEARAPSPFSVPRAPAAYRVIVLGESAALGDPEPAYGLARMLQGMLEARFTGRVDVVNAAMTAINSHVMLRIARELPALRPDAVVIYAGNNEVIGPFGPSSVQRPASRWPALTMALRGARVGQAASGWIAGRGPRRGWTGLQPFMERLVTADDPRLARVYAAWRENLAATVRSARDAGARTILCTMGTNLRLPPLASRNRGDLTPGERAAWVEAAGRGTREGLERALEIDGGHALAHHRLGLLLEQAGDTPAASNHLARARDLDALRLRADSVIEDIIRDLAPRADGWVDAERLLAGPGDFYDHVHLTFEGTWKLAGAVERALLPGVATPAPDRAACAQRLAFTPWDRRRVQEEMADRLRHPPFEMDPGPVAPLSARDIAVSQRIYREALDAHPDDIALRLGRGRLNLSQGDVIAARADVQAVLDAWPHSLEAHHLAGRLAVRQSDWAAAERSFREASALGRRSRAQALLDIGTELADLGRMAESRDWLERAVAADPRQAFAHYNLGLACSALRDDAAARRCYEEALRRDPRMVQARNNLGAVLLRGGDARGAADQFREALRLDARYATAHRNLAAALEALGDRAGARAEYEAVLRMDPADAEARDALRRP